MQTRIRLRRRQLIGAAISAAAIGWAPAEASTQQPGRWALVVGVSAASDTSIPALEYADDDAEDVRRALVTRVGFTEDRVTAMTSRSAGTLKPTVENVEQQARDIARRARPGDLIVFFFSCHGFMINGVTPCLACADTETAPGRLADTALHVARLAEILLASSASNLLLILDACRETQQGGRGAHDLTLLRPKAIVPVPRPTKSYGIMLACGDGQQAYEDPASRHGAFTNALLEVLHDWTPLASTLSARTLTQEVSSRMHKTYGNRQTPKLIGDNVRIVAGADSVTVRREGRAATFTAIESETDWIVCREDPGCARQVLVRITADACDYPMARRARVIRDRIAECYRKTDFDQWRASLFVDLAWKGQNTVVAYSDPCRDYVVTVTDRDFAAWKRRSKSEVANDMIQLLKVRALVAVRDGRSRTAADRLPEGLAPGCYHQQATMHAAFGDWSSACDEFAHAVRLEGREPFVAARLGLVDALIHLNERARARAELDSLLRTGAVLSGEQRASRHRIEATLAEIGR